MTTTVSFATRDCVVIGCDSLATSTYPFIDPFELINNFFELSSSKKNKGGISLKKNKDGEVVLKDVGELLSLSQQVPYNQQPNVTKIFYIKPAKVGVLFAGIAAIGEMSVKNIIDDFLDNEDTIKYLQDYTVYGVSERLSQFIRNLYNSAFPKDSYKPALEIIVSGYSKRFNKPEICKVEFDADKDGTITKSCERGKYKIVFGGQYDIIQRLVYGIDLTNFVKLRNHLDKILYSYKNHVESHLKSQNFDLKLPDPFDIEETKDLIETNFWDGVDLSLPNFSEQAAIDFVEFLVEIMIKAQQFSNKLPTVGGIFI